MTSDQLRAAIAAYETEHPRARQRNVAEALGVSEAEVVATRCGTGGALRLRPDWRTLLTGLEACGRLMALTRNDDCVHERKGVYANADVSDDGKMALFVNPDIDLRIFLTRWHHAFFVEDAQPKGEPRLSIQVFDRDGAAVHKVYATDGTDRGAFRALADRVRHEDQSGEIAVETAAPAPLEKPLSEIDVDGLVAGWQELEDTHDFFLLLRRFGVSRRQAVRLAPRALARPVHPFALRAVLEGAAASGVPLMVFVGSAGCVQIHTGPVEKVVEAGPWFNVLDADFNLHVRESAIAEAYVVVKPTADGDVTALEFFDEDGGLVVQFFGKRKPGVPERDDWRALVAAVEQHAGLAAVV